MRNRRTQPLKQLLKTSAIGRALLIPYRFAIALSYYGKPLRHMLTWCFRSREFTNFTYNLDVMNQAYLAAFISTVTGVHLEAIQEYIKELEEDAALRDHIQSLTLASNEAAVADLEVRYGRRIGWYAFVRALKPQVVVETGVDKGLGSCVLTAALMRNAAEGFPGYYYGTDVNPNAGYLLKDPYARYGTILYGDSIESLSRLQARIGLFVNDSDHSPEYEMREYETVQPLLCEKAVIIGDNAHWTRQLFDFARKTDRSFLFFQERPKDHWYPGGGIGVAFPARPHNPA
jgi:hypothetical protein